MHTPDPARSPPTPPDSALVNKAGLLVCTRRADGGQDVLVITPPWDRERFPNDPPPAQLPKGTRAVVFPDGRMEDLRDNDQPWPGDLAALLAGFQEKGAVLEPLKTTALREFNEETGGLELPTAAVRHMRDAGVVWFTSARHGTPVPLQLFTVTVPRASLPTPAADALWQWADAAQLAQANVRPDNAAIIQAALGLLRNK